MTATVDELLTALVLVVAGLTLIPVMVLIARRVFPGRVVFFARWGFSHVAVVVLVELLAIAVIGSVPGASTPALLAKTAAIELVAAVVILGYAHKLQPEGVRALGLRTDHTPRALFLGAAILVVGLPMVWGTSVLWPWAFELMGGKFELQEHLVGFAELEGGQLWLGLALAVVVAPALEELSFRGFLQPLLVQNFGEPGGLVVTSVLFAALHGASPFLPLFAISMLLGGVMLRSRRLAAPWCMHALFNAGNLALVIYFPDQVGQAGQPGLLGLVR